MSLTTLIQWCHATVNFWWGCTKVSAGCAHCYAEMMARRLGAGRVSWGPDGARWLRVPEACLELFHLERRAVRTGQRLRVFINSMADTFENRSDLNQARAVLFAVAGCVPHLDLLLLTKRVECVEKLTPVEWFITKWPDNVWLGFTAEDQAALDARWPVVEHLARRFQIPVTFCSAEPLLGALNLDIVRRQARSADEPELRQLDWLIVGGESGQSARPCQMEWIRFAIAQAREMELPIFVKQLGRRPVSSVGWTGPLKCIRDSHGGKIAEWPEDLRVRELPSSQV